MRDTFLLLVVDLGSFFGGVCVGGVGSMFLDYCCVTCVWNLSRRGSDARRSLQLFSSSSLCAMLLCDDEIPDTVLGPLSYICHMYFVVPAPSLSPFLEQPTPLSLSSSACSAVQPCLVRCHFWSASIMWPLLLYLTVVGDGILGSVRCRCTKRALQSPADLHRDMGALFFPLFLHVHFRSPCTNQNHAKNAIEV